MPLIRTQVDKKPLGITPRGLDERLPFPVPPLRTNRWGAQRFMLRRKKVQSGCRQGRLLARLGHAHCIKRRPSLWVRKTFARTEFFSVWTHCRHHRYRRDPVRLWGAAREVVLAPLVCGG